MVVISLASWQVVMIADWYNRKIHTGLSKEGKDKPQWNQSAV